MDSLVVGARVRFCREVWRYPHFIVPAGTLGTVTNWDAELVAVRLDPTIVGAEDWDNECHWYPTNCDDDPTGDIVELREEI